MSTKAAVLALFSPGFLLHPSVSGPSTTQDQIALHERMAQQYLREQRPELAIPELEKLATLDPGNVDARANLGVLLFFHGDYKDAVPQLQAAVKFRPDLWKVQALLGMAEEHTSDLPMRVKIWKHPFRLFRIRS